MLSNLDHIFMVIQKQLSVLWTLLLCHWFPETVTARTSFRTSLRIGHKNITKTFST